MRILGMMSGTSVDAIDTAVLRLGRARDEDTTLEMTELEVAEHLWPPDLRAALLGAVASAAGGPAEWTRWHVLVGERFAEVAARVIEQVGGVDLIVCHGQTLHHWVEADGTARGSLQIGDASRIAERTRTPVLYDLRAADLARGGQGAPLAPILDALLLGPAPGAALNLGGIANVTLSDGENVLAGDIGPAGALIDAAVAEASGGTRTHDVDGALARTGRVDERLLHRLLEDPFLALPLPRSTGREYFDAGYVRRRAPGTVLDLPDLVATLTEFTARTVADVITGAGAQQVIGSGGGMRNPVLVGRLRTLLDPIPLVPSDELGIPGDAKEAVLMALLGYLSAHGLPGVLPGTGSGAATGATECAVLGSLTPPVALAGLDPGPAATMSPAGTMGPDPPMPRCLRILPSADRRSPDRAPDVTKEDR